MEMDRNNTIQNNQPNQGKTNWKFLLIVVILAAIVGGGILWFSQQQISSYQPLEIKISEKVKPENSAFIPLSSSASPTFIQSLSNAKDVKMDFHYEGDYVGFEPLSSDFYYPEGSNEKFLSLSKIIKEEGQYSYGPDYYSIFTSKEGHSYQGSPIYLANQDPKYSVAYVGFKISDKNLISDLKIEFGIDFGGVGIRESKSSIFSSIFGIETAYACGPGMYGRVIGSSNLTFIEESSGIAWYRPDNPVALYNLPSYYCEQDCTTMPDYCNNLADDPSECDAYYCCFYNAGPITNFANGKLSTHIFYKPNDKEGFLQLQVVSLILKNPAGMYFQPIMGTGFDHFYRAYLH